MAKARTKVRARAKKTDVRRSAARPVRAKASAPKARRQHKFVASHLGPNDFKADGLRTYAHYRDLGIKDATRGMALAHVIRFVGKCDPKVVSKNHTHECEFQMIYVLKGQITTRDRGPRQARDERRRLLAAAAGHRAQGARLFRRLRGAGDRAAGGVQDGRAGKVARVLAIAADAQSSERRRRWSRAPAR